MSAGADADAPRWIHEIPARRAALRSDDPALVQGAMRWRYRDWEAAIAVATDALGDEGLRAGDRMLVVAENGLVAATLIHAISRLAAWPVVVNARLTASEIDAIAAHAEARMIAFTADVSQEAARHADRLGAREARWGALPSFRIAGPRAATPESVPDAPDARVGALIYTSGTTGSPKGVMLSHRNLLHVARHTGRLRGMAPGERVYGALPMSHVFGLASVFCGTMYYGGALHLVPRFDPREALAMLRDDRLTVFQGVPAMFARLLEHVAAPGARIEAPALRYASSGGAPLDLALKAEVEAALGTTLHNGYGMTELSPTVTLTLIESPRRDDAVGPPLSGVEVRIVGADGREVAPGAVGTLHARGPTVMLGYYRAPEATAAIVSPDGWLDTGDLARREADGTLFIVGRAKELIIRSGFNVYPEEVEAALRAHPDVTLAVVVGRPAAAGNEEVIAFVQPRAGAARDEAALAAWCAERLAPYKRPSRIVFMDALPATSTGKLLKHVLRARARALDAAAADAS